MAIGGFGTLLTADNVATFLKLAPDLIEAGKGIFTIVHNDDDKLMDHGDETRFYSKKLGFTISWPKKHWQFWKPTPDVGTASGFPNMPTRSIPVILLSDVVIRGFRPTVNIVVEDIGPIMNVQDVIQCTISQYKMAGIYIRPEDVKILDDKSNGVMIVRSPTPMGDILFQVLKIHIYNERAYYITASQTIQPGSSEGLSGTSQQIMNSFALIKPA